MSNLLFWIAVTLVSLYVLLPWILTRVLGWRVLRRGHGQSIALTFDDGPHPEYTEQLLDLLAEHGISATFFVLGKNAERYPSLIARIHRDGHMLGIHNYEHVSNALLSPQKIAQEQVQRTANIIAQITGERPRYYRPPWGVPNLFDLFIHRPLRLVMWSGMIMDWRKPQVDQQQQVTKLTQQIRPGAVILLHDSGDTIGADSDAPAYMLRALRQVLDDPNTDKTQFVRIDEMDRMSPDFARRHLSLSKRFFVNLWLKWEKLFARLFDVIPVDEANTLLKIRVREYQGEQPITLHDGVVIRKGDQIAELHLDNDLLFRLGSESKSMMQLTVQLVRRIEHLLPQITRLLDSDPLYKDVKGLYGISMIHRGTRQFGFTVLDMPDNAFSSLTRWYLRLLMYAVHPEGKNRLQTKPHLLVPKIIAISRRELNERYIS